VRGTEVHVEQLLGKRVRDADGRVLGRLEEFHVGQEDGEDVVTEFLIGPGALFQRIGGFVTQLPYFRLIPLSRREYCVSWKLMDLSDPEAPRVLACRDELPEA
jgi:sporulation protein YlmC with PRC-barrel domain